MQKQQFKNLKDLFQNKYGLNMNEVKSNSRNTSIHEVLKNLKRSKDVSPVPKSAMREDILNFSKAIGCQAPKQSSRSKEKTPLHEKKGSVQITNYSIAQTSKGHSRNSSSQSRNTSSHSIVNDSTNRSVAKDAKIPRSGIAGRMRDRNDVSLLIDQQKQRIINLSYDQQPSTTKQQYYQHHHHQQTTTAQQISIKPLQQQQPQLLAQPTPVTFMKTPQIKGNIDLVNLLKQQTQNDKSRELNRPQEDEQLIVDNVCSINKNYFSYHYVVGKGGFGKVWRVEMKKNRVQYAMKEMLKSKIIAKRSINSVMNERQLLSELRHSFLVNMSYAFQDRDTLYLIMDLLTGGDLRFHIGRMRRFKEHQTKFFVACILLGLEYLHDNSIIHRDIKPENIVLDKRGFARITDLGIARRARPDNAADTSGTPGYMAPEVMCRQNHGIAVDYFALGVITYEFMLGKRPYQGRSRKEIRDQILAKQASVKKEEVPVGWSIEAMDFINKLLQRKPQNRLGYNGPLEVKNHPWLKGVPWDKLISKQIEAPYLPTSAEDMYKQQVTDGEESQDELMQENQMLLKKNSVQNLFAGYGYDCTTDPNIKVPGNTRSTISTHNTSQVNDYLKN